MVVVVVGLGAYLWQTSAEYPKQDSPQMAKPVLAPAPATKSAPRPIIEASPTPDDGAVVATRAEERVEDAGVEAPDAAADDVGVFDIDLGTHTVYLRDPKLGRRVRLSLLAQSRSRAGRSQVRRMRRKLVRMLFFLLSKRNPEAIERADARTRLEADLFDRFVQVVPGNALTGLTIEKYEVIKNAPRLDGGLDP